MKLFMYVRVSETSYSVCNCEVEEIYHIVGGRKIVKILQRYNDNPDNEEAEKME